MKTKGNITRGRILEAARELFKTKGFRATTISDLVIATGMQKGSIYFHFPGKDAIARQVISNASFYFIRFLNRSLEGDNPGAAIDHYFNRVLDKHLAKDFSGGCLFGNTALEMCDNNPELAGTIDTLFDEWIGIVSSAVSKAQKSGQIRGDVSSTTLARQIVATIEGGIMMSRLKRDGHPLRECLDALRISLELRISR